MNYSVLNLCLIDISFYHILYTWRLSLVIRVYIFIYLMIYPHRLHHYVLYFLDMQVAYIIHLFIFTFCHLTVFDSLAVMFKSYDYMKQELCRIYMLCSLMILFSNVCKFRFFVSNYSYIMEYI